jgi:hypothetical protein
MREEKKRNSEAGVVCVLSMYEALGWKVLGEEREEKKVKEKKRRKREKKLKYYENKQMRTKRKAT